MKNNNKRIAPINEEVTEPLRSGEEVDEGDLEMNNTSNNNTRSRIQQNARYITVATDTSEIEEEAGENNKNKQEATTNNNNNNNNIPIAAEVFVPTNQVILMGVPIGNNVASSASSSQRHNEELNVLHIKTIDERIHDIQIRPGSTLGSLKVLVEQMCGVPYQDQRLIANGRILNGDNEILDLPNGSFIHLAPLMNSPPIFSSTTTAASSSPSSSFMHYQQNPSSVASRSVASQYEEPDSIVEQSLHALRPGAYCIIIWFSLVTYSALTTLWFGPEEYNMNDDNNGNPPNRHGPTQAPRSPEEITASLVCDLVIGLYGIFVGNLGLRCANSIRTTANDARKVAFAVQVYFASHSLLLLLYTTRILIFSALNGTFGASLLIVFYVVSCFMLCTLQIRRAIKVIGRELMPSLLPRCCIVTNRRRQVEEHGNPQMAERVLPLAAGHVATATVISNNSNVVANMPNAPTTTTTMIRNSEIA